MLLKPITEITENWGDMEDSDDEDYQEGDSMSSNGRQQRVVMRLS